MNCKILLVDDEPYVEDMMKQKFRSAIREGKITFEYVSSGFDAIDKLKADDTFDLVLTDINMPGMTGLTLLEKIKEHTFFVKTIVISAYSDLENIRTAMNRGAFDFITKPVDLVDLEKTIYKTIEEIKLLKEGHKAAKELDQALIDKAKAQQEALENLLEKEKIILEQNERLENLVVERTAQLQQQKSLVEEKNKEILDSIHYASHLQQAILPQPDILKNHFKDHFILYRPKDIVSGDFYWMEKIDNTVVVSVADCTGHGVAGALMSMLGVSLLNQIVYEQGATSPAKILDKLHEAVSKSLQQSQNNSNQGMDIAICCFNFDTKQVIYAGANRPLVFVASKELKIIAPDKTPIGGSQFERTNGFTNHVLPFTDFEIAYLFTDGYADQFGGEHSKKIMTKKLKEILLEIKNHEMPAQKKFLNDFFTTWMNGNEQVDDVLIAGLKI
ncbi:MAG: response regulator [Bacteroidetes bacterium]|nr:response regulator [Bacteroidota bacterium]